MARFMQASFHQGNAMYQGRGRQCMANALSSLIMAQKRSPLKWNANTLNEILENGDNIYKCSSVNSYMLLEDLPKECQMYDNLQLNTILSGSVYQKISERPFFTLENAVDHILKDLNSQCIITIGKSNPSYSCCIIKENKTYYFFDPHSRNEIGMPTPDGFATLTVYNNASALCQFVRQLSEMLFTGHTDIQFEVASIILTSSRTIDTISSDEQSFDGFSEISEGDVTCKLYMINEDLEQSVSVSDVSTCTIISDTESSDNIPLALLQKKIVNTGRVISDTEDTFSDLCSSGSEYKFTSFERKLLNNELSESEMTLSESDDSLYYAPPFKKKKLKKVKQHRTCTIMTTKTSTPKFKLDQVRTDTRQKELGFGVREDMVQEYSSIGNGNVDGRTSNVGDEGKEGELGKDNLVGKMGVVGEQAKVGEDGMVKDGMVGEAGMVKDGMVGEDGMVKDGMLGEDGMLKDGMIGEDGMVKDGMVGEDGMVEDGMVGEKAKVGEVDMVEQDKAGEQTRVGEDGIVGNCMVVGDGVLVEEGLISVEGMVGKEGMSHLENIVGNDCVAEGDIVGIDDMIGAEVIVEGYNNVSDQDSFVNSSVVGENGMDGVDATIGDHRTTCNVGNGECNKDGESMTEDSMVAGESMVNVETSGRDKDVRYRSRKRTSNPDKWKRNVLKRLKNTGQEFINFRGNPQRAKCVKPGCGEKCRFKCHSFLNRELRETIFHKFWELGNVTQQRQFILKHSEPKGKANKTILGSSNRSNSFKYTLPGNENSVRVCKTFFLHTLNISGQMVQTALKKSLYFPGVCQPDKRGKHNTRPNKTPDDKLKYIKDHIASFQTVESHYCRKDSQKMYLCPGLSVPKMYRLYCEKCAKDNIQPVTLSLYRSVFDHNFNLSFFKPVKDQCDTCNAYRNSTKSHSEKEKAMQENHLKNKVAAREGKEHDKLKAKSGQDDSFIASCFDLEQILMTPKGFESTLYYKRRLNTYNFSIYNLANSKAHCYLWNETLGGRGASEISSCIYKYIQVMAEKGKKKFVFFSDNCSSQNKNKYYVSMLWYALQKFNLTSIEHKYLEKGHTQNENDSVHAAIEAASRHVSVYSTSQWAAIIRAARPKNPYTVKEMDVSDFLNFKTVANVLKNFDLDTERQKVYWSEVRTFCIKSENPNTIALRYNYDGAVHYLNLVERLRRTQFIVSPENIVLQRLHDDQLPITREKYTDLISLCKNEIIPKVHHIFYLLLPHQ